MSAMVTRVDFRELLTAGLALQAMQSGAVGMAQKCHNQALKLSRGASKPHPRTTRQTQGVPFNTAKRSIKLDDLQGQQRHHARRGRGNGLNSPTECVRSASRAAASMAF